MGRPVTLIFCCSFSVLLTIFTLSDGGAIGVNYGRIANNLPSPAKAVQLLKSQGLDRVKLYDSDPLVLKALSNSGIKVTIALPNELLYPVSKHRSFALSWVQTNVLSHYPQTQIHAIAVGNEVFSDPNNTTLFLVPAMRNIHSALLKYNLHTSIKISSPIALNALQSSYPPSSGSFKPEFVEPVMKPLLGFLRQTGSSLMVNAYPFFAYSANPDLISIDYALFRDNPGAVDPNNGLRYFSLFDAQIDAVFSAMSALQFDDLGLIVSETGWPSNGDEAEVGATVDNACGYNGGLVKRVFNGGGTPLKPRSAIDVYLFALFNENSKPGLASERNYGLFYPDERKVYEVPFTAEGARGWRRSTPVKGGERRTSTPVNGGGLKGETWCVADGRLGREKLQEALDYACGEGGADCRPIQPGATCYDPDTVEAHASFAFNSYYQKKGRAMGTCYFGGAAFVVTQRPKFGKCEYPSGN